MVQVAGYTPLEAATGLFYINAAMLCTFWGWGLVNPRLAQHGWPADRLLLWCLPLSLVALAGRALSAYNLVIFSGVFCVQWGIGLAVDAFAAVGLEPVARFQAAMAIFLCCCTASYLYLAIQPDLKADNLSQ